MNHSFISHQKFLWKAKTSPNHVMPPKIELYAELLTYIRTVTLVATLQTATNDETRITLSSDNQTITISHDGISASLRLPTRMVGGGTAALTLPPRPSKDLSLRLKVEETSPGLLTFEHSDENLVPWPATGMDDAKGLKCRACGKGVVKMDQVSEWRDLPNENWAEMMDFWHCHKPHEHGDGEDCGTGDGKGYAAGNKLAVKEGMGYAGLSYFILAEKDCENVQVKSGADTSRLHCESCDHPLGLIDPAVEGYRLYKWSLSVVKHDSTLESFSVPKWISTQLLAMVDNSGVRRFVVEPSAREDGTSDGLLLWLFTDSLSFSSSYMFFTRKDPTRAMKILWKPVENAAKLMDENHFSHEHVLFPRHVYATLKQTLENSQFLLPQSARRYQDWNVGLLQRFSWEDVGGSDATVLPAPKIEMPIIGLNDPERKEEVEDAREAIRKIYGSEALLE